MAPSGEPSQKPYVLMANFSLAGMHGLRCREGWHTVRAPPAVSSVDEQLGAAGAPAVPAGNGEFTIDPEQLPKGLPAGSEGVETSYVPTAAQRSQWTAELQAEQKKSDAHWDAVIKAKNWSSLSTPLDCFKFESGLTSDPRGTPEYKQKVLEELGLLSPEGLEHLDAYDRAAIVEVFSRKTGAFLAKDTPRTCLRAFQHDVVVAGAPVRGFPIKLSASESAFVERELEKAEKQGMYTKGSSPWGS